MSITNNNNQFSDDIVAEINMTPLIDIMLVLLIIFMVSSTVAIQSALDVDLPKTSQTTEPKKAETILVSLDKKGQLAVQGTIVKKEELEQVMVDTIKKLNTDAVVFEGDTKSEFGAAVEIMDIAKKAGAKSFSIAAEQDDLVNKAKNEMENQKRIN